MRKIIGSPLFFVIKFTFFIALINVFLTLGTLTLHEFGHSLAAAHYGCSHNKITFTIGESPYTEIECEENINLTVILFAGIIFTSLLSLILFFSSSGIPKYLACIIFSVGIIAASIDLAFLSINETIIFFFNMVSYLLMALSVTKIALLYFEIEIK